MASLSYSRDLHIPPSAAGMESRLACARAREAGIDVAPLMEKAGLTSRQVEDDEIRLPVKGQIKFLELIANALQDDFLGFHLARDFDLREMGLLYYVLNSAGLLGEALRRAERYSTTLNEGVTLRVREGNALGVTFNYVRVERLSDRHQIEFWVTGMVRMCRKLTNRHLRPDLVNLLHRRSGGSGEMNRFFGCDVLFGANTDEVTFSGPVKEMPILDADPYLNKLLVKYCEEVHPHRSDRGSFRVAVENAIAPVLPHGRARLDEIASELGLSPRTLTRRLASEGLTFENILTELKTDLARRYLLDEALPISEIAWLVGYKEVSAFTNAFKRWTSKTPSQARQEEKFGI